MELVFSHPTGNANVRGALDGLLKASMLSSFHTSIASFPGSVLDRIGAFGPLSEIRRRRFSADLKSLTHVWPYKEVGRLLASKVGWHQLLKHESGNFSVDQVYQYIDKKTAGYLIKAQHEGAAGVYAYEDGALNSFHEAHRLGMKCWYDLPIGYWRSAHRLLQIEAERWPEWASTLTGFLDTATKLSRKDEELRLADRIFVASTFTAETLSEYTGKLSPVTVVPYGFPPINLKKKAGIYNGNRALKMLFVGGLSQRKGIAGLFKAADAFGKNVELTVVGRKPVQDCEVLNRNLVKHKWFDSLPHSDVLKLMYASDVLIFPSLFEGFGLVITEAMAQGTPVITTERTAGPDVISNGLDGWITKAGDVTELHQAVERLLMQPAILKTAGAAALQTAAKRPWEVYGAELAQALTERN